MKPFVHLHLHSEYSLLDGAVRLKNLFSACEQMGMPAVAVTDHGNMFAAVNFYDAAARYTDPTIDPEAFEKSGQPFKVKPIFGCEFYVDRDIAVKGSGDGRMPKFHHLVLLAKDYEGYLNLVALNSIAYVDGFYYKPRIDYTLLKKHTKGLICLSACLAGGVPQALLAGDYEGAKALALELKGMFAVGDFYIELQDHRIPEQRLINPDLARIAKEIGVKVVATNDVHYLRRKDSEMQKVLQCISFRRTINDALGNDRGEDYFPTDEFYLKSGEEMTALFGYIPEALETTLEVAEKCNVHMKFKQQLLPGFTPPDGLTPSEYLRQLTFSGLERKYKSITDEVRERAEYELGIIDKSGFVEYFLIVWDFIHYAEGIGVSVGPGRGSGVGSIVAYAIGITKVDPLRYNLLFERFLNSERVSMPDFDIDFCVERRGEVIDYVIKKYGEARVAQIVTFGTLAAKAAIKDVGRVYSIPYSETDRISKLIPFSAAKIPLSRYVGIVEEGFVPKEGESPTKFMIPDLRKRYDEDDDVRKVLDMAMSIEGMPRQTSMHAAGVVICKDDIAKFVPLQRNGEDVTTQFDMIQVERLGLLKMDFLGLRTLTDIKKAVDYVKENHGVELDFYDMEYNDPKVYEMIGSGSTHAVFQIESAGMRKFFTRLQPTNMEDIIAGIALFRPGPMDSIDDYLKNKNNPGAIKYKDPILKPILEMTYGCIIYQEQVMQIVREMAGYSLGRADIVRRLMSKKKAKLMAEEREIFVNGKLRADGSVEVEGAVRRGIPAEAALDVFAEMESFAQYAFNKSHAAAYAYLTYQTAYLKCYYEVEFITAVLNNRITNIDEIRNYLAYLKERNIAILPPDINKSKVYFSTEGGGVRIGLGALKNVGIKAIETIIAEREEGGEYRDFPDFIGRMEDGVLNRKMLESLILAGAFDRFNVNRSVLMAVYGPILDRAASDRQARLRGQFSMFDTLVDAGVKVDYPPHPEFPLMQKLKLERDVLGVYVSGHPLDEYREELSKLPFNTSMLERAEAAADEEAGTVAALAQDDMAVRCGGMLTDFRRHIVKSSGKEMGFAKLEDLYGAVDLMFTGYKYEQYKAEITDDMLVIISGKLSAKEGESPIIRVDTLEPLRAKPVEGEAVKKPAGRRICLCYSFGSRGEDFLSDIQDILSQYRGHELAYIKNYDNGKVFELDERVKIDNPLLNELYSLLDSEDILIR